MNSVNDVDIDEVCAQAYPIVSAEDIRQAALQILGEPVQ